MDLVSNSGCLYELDKVEKMIYEDDDGAGIAQSCHPPSKQLPVKSGPVSLQFATPGWRPDKTDAILTKSLKVTSRKGGKRGLAAWRSVKGHFSCNGIRGSLSISPLVRLRASKLERSLLGSQSPLLVENSFENNQSFPRCMRSNMSEVILNSAASKVTALSMEKFKGDELNSFSYSMAQHCAIKDSFAKTPDSVLSQSFPFTESCSMYSLMNSAGGPTVSATTILHNPNKAVLTMDAKTFQILVVNDTACRLFNMPSEELCTKRLQELFVQFRRGPETLAETLLETSGQIVLVSGKVLEAISSSGEIVPVSLWMRKLELDGYSRCIAVMEPVLRKSAVVTFDGEGIILCADVHLASLLGYQDPCEIEGSDIHMLIPSLIIPDSKPGHAIPQSTRKQNCTGRTKDGTTFPLSIYLEPEIESQYSRSSVTSGSACNTGADISLLKTLDPKEERCHSSLQSSLICEVSLTSENRELGRLDQTTDISNESLNDPKNCVYTGIVWVFGNISGMITLLPDGTIHSCNHYFALLLFGYPQNHLVGKNISYLIPSFYDDQEFLDSDSALFAPFDDEDDELENQVSEDELAQFDVDATNNVVNKLNSIHLQSGDESESYTPAQHNIMGEHPRVISSLMDNPLHSLNLNDPSGGNEGGNAPNVIPSGIDYECATNGAKESPQVKSESWKAALPDINGNPMKNDGSSHEQDGVRNRNASVSPHSCHSESDNGSSNTLTQFSETPFIAVTSSNDLVTPMPNNGSEPCLPSPLPETTEVPRYHFSSTPSETPQKEKSSQRILEGSYFGLCRHRDGSELGIVYQVRMIYLEDGQVLYCVWVSQDPEEPVEGFRLNSTLATASSFNSSLGISSSVLSSMQGGVNHKLRSDVSSQSSFDYSATDCTRGAYSEHYTTLEQIGKGAFGCVKLATRNLDKKLVVTKFIRKGKVYKECWVNDNILQKMVPLEVSLLVTLNHPNIVKVLDVYENEDFFQMVMEKHGCGMDLFEFIDRATNVEEALASYIFRQVVSAVSYLHSLNIVHRDVKDENIILDEKFHVKLIDLGSAAFMAPDRLFSTFCGTVEYCSPEVLSGEKYKGPELEMWSLGVTLYTLIFGENPFFDVDETLQGVLHPPFEVSKDLSKLILHLLHPDPGLRCTLRDLEVNSWLYQPIKIENYSFDEIVNLVSLYANYPKYITNLDC